MAQGQGKASGNIVVVVAFLMGFIGALVVGWVVFPRVLYSTHYQPVNFSHLTHSDNDCDYCHYFRSDGTYSGIPNIDNCRECHEEMLGDSEAERILVEEYIKQNKPIPWLVYEWQPDNVYFSHVPHRDIDCVRCHRDVSKEENNPVVYVNRLTGYSKTTMKMTECEKCHAERGASNACQVCHK